MKYTCSRTCSWCMRWGATCTKAWSRSSTILSDHHRPSYDSKSNTQCYVYTVALQCNIETVQNTCMPSWGSYVPQMPFLLHACSAGMQTGLLAMPDLLVGSVIKLLLQLWSNLHVRPMSMPINHKWPIIMVRPTSYRYLSRPQIPKECLRFTRV